MLTRRNIRNSKSGLDSAAWGGRLLLVLLLISGTMWAKDNGHSNHPKLSQELQNVDGGKSLNVIVQFTSTPTSKHYAKVTAKGAALHRKLDVIKGGAFKHLPASRLKDLEADPDVAYISPDRAVKLSAITTNSNGQAVYPAQAINADLAWALGFDGSGVGVAVVDSGISEHPDLHSQANGNSRVVYGESFLGDGTTADLFGHGTHVSGIIAGNGAAAAYSNRYHGIAPGVSLVNLRVLDANGSGTDSSVIAAIQRAIQLKSTYNIRVLNLSLGRGVYESYTLDPLDQAVEQAWKAGIVVVTAAGNSGRDNTLGTQGYGTINVPGNDPYVITVGATATAGLTVRINDTIASYSSKGPTLLDHVVKPDLVAPGNQIVSLRVPGSTLDANYQKYAITAPCDVTLTDTCTSFSGSPQYFKLSGTSMSTPMVTGAAALMLQEEPGLTPDQVKARLMKTAWKGFTPYGTSMDAQGRKYSTQYDIFTYGAGYLDMYTAMLNTDVAQGAALSPTATYNALTRTVTISTNSYGVPVVWDGSVLWGSSVIWGANIFVNGSSVLWGSSVIWGANTSQGFAVLWGSSVLWGSTTFTALSDDDDGDVPPDDPSLTTTDITTVLP